MRWSSDSDVARWHEHAKDWVSHIQSLEDEIHSMRQVQFEVKKKQACTSKQRLQRR